jgi:hypothetical protein
VLIVIAEWCDSLRAPRLRFKGMTISGALTALALVPWGGYVAYRARITHHQLEVVDWITRPMLHDLIEPYAWLLGGSPWYAADLAVAVIAGGAIAYWLLKKRGTAQGDAGITLLVAVTVPVLITFAFSTVAPRSAWVMRYMIVVAVPLVVLVAASVNSIAPRFRSVTPALLALWVAGTAAQWLRADQEKVHFERIAAGIAARGGTPAVVYSEDLTDLSPLAWSAKNISPPITVHPIVSIDSVHADGGWILWGEAHPPRGLPPAAALIRRGYALGEPVFSTGMHDSVIALPFSRRARP